MNGKLDPEEHVMEPPTIIEQINSIVEKLKWEDSCLLYTSPSPRD